MSIVEHSDNDNTQITQLIDHITLIFNGYFNFIASSSKLSKDNADILQKQFNDSIATLSNLLLSMQQANIDLNDSTVLSRKEMKQLNYIFNQLSNQDSIIYLTRTLLPTLKQLYALPTTSLQEISDRAAKIREYQAIIDSFQASNGIEPLIEQPIETVIPTVIDSNGPKTVTV